MNALRLDWNNEGSNLVVSNSTNNGVPNAQCIRTSDWLPTVDFIGHRGPTTIVVLKIFFVNYFELWTNSSSFLNAI